MSHAQVKQSVLVPSEPRTRESDARVDAWKDTHATKGKKYPVNTVAGTASPVLKKRSSDEGCPDSYSKAYAGTNCAGDDAWFAANGNLACECIGGLCKHCCFEEIEADGSWACSWEVDKTRDAFVADDACPEGLRQGAPGEIRGQACPGLVTIFFSFPPLFERWMSDTFRGKRAAYGFGYLVYAVGPRFSGQSAASNSEQNPPKTSTLTTPSQSSLCRSLCFRRSSPPRRLCAAA